MVDCSRGFYYWNSLDHVWNYTEPPEHDAADALHYATGFITLDKTKSVPFTVDRPETYFEKEKSMKTIKDVDRIVITKNDLNEVLLRAYSGDEIVIKTIAICSPGDIFDFNIGAKLSVDRLYDGYDMTPKSKRKPYNGKIFVRGDVRNFEYLGFDFLFKEPAKKYTRENKIWEVKDGKIIAGSLARRATDIIYEDMTDEELTKLLCSTNNSIQGLCYNIVDGYFVR